MMSRYTLLSIGMMLTGVALPLQVAAYVPPEDVLDDEEFNISQYFTPPPSAREAEAVWDAQNSSAAARRAAEQQALYDAQHPQEEPETMHGAAPATEDDMGPEWEALIKALEALSQDEADNSAQLSAEELRNQRILNRIEVQQAQAEYQAQLQALGLVGGNDETLHSGAPLSETGPAAVLTVLAIAGALGVTMRRVHTANKR